MHHQTTPPFVLEYVQLPTIHDYAIQQFDIGPQLPAVFMMVGPAKPGENIPARRYSITELLAMKSSLPYVSCPLNRFKPDAWTENLLYRKRIPNLPDSLIERRQPKRYVTKDEETVLDSAARERVGRLVPEMNFQPGSIEFPATLGAEPEKVKEAAQRQPVGPADGNSAGFGRTISHSIRPPPGLAPQPQPQNQPIDPNQMTTEEIAMAYGPAMAAAVENSKRSQTVYCGGQDYPSPARHSSRYGNVEMVPNQDTPLSTQELLAMGVPLGIQMVPVMMSPYASPDRYTNRPYQPTQVNMGHRVQSPQGLDIRGNHRSGSVSGMMPADEASGAQWGAMGNTVRSTRSSVSVNQAPIRSTYYGGVGMNQQENAVTSDTYRGIQPVSSSKHGLWIGHPNVVMNLPPPDAPGSMLGRKPTSNDQLSFIEYMNKQNAMRNSSGRYASGTYMSESGVAR